MIIINLKVIAKKEFKEKIKKELENSYYAALRETKAKYDEGENPPHYYRGIYPTEVEEMSQGLNDLLK